MTNSTTKTHELHEGIGGNGNTIYLVVTVLNGRWIWKEEFTTRSEAGSWLKYAC